MEIKKDAPARKNLESLCSVGSQVLQAVCGFDEFSKKKIAIVPCGLWRPVCGKGRNLYVTIPMSCSRSIKVHIFA
jgi:hypothetical protein